MSQVLEALQWEIEGGWYTLRLGSVTFTISPRELYARTTFSDGAYVEARPDWNRDTEMALGLGYLRVKPFAAPQVSPYERRGIVRMFLAHDFCHNFLAWKVFHSPSPTLWSVSRGLTGCFYEVRAQAEERDVFDFQKLLTGKLTLEDADRMHFLPVSDWAALRDEARALLQVLEAGAEG